MQSIDVIVGSGISAHAFLWTYALALKQGRLDDARRVVWIKSEIVPTCSLTSTSLISSAGLERGVSPLGEQLLDAYQVFESRCANFAAVSKATQTHLAHGDLENFKRRYANAQGECYVIDSHNFLRELSHEAQTILGERLIYKNDTVISWQHDHLVLHSKQKLNFDRCYIALGAGINFLAPVKGSRTVAGHYAWANVDLGQQSFVFSRGPMNLIYRALDKVILLGSVDDKNDQHGWPVIAPRVSELKKSLAQFEFDLPSNLKWQVATGIRHKGVKRRPFWGEIATNLWGTHSLYKNGYTLAFLAADEVISKWCEKN